MNTRLLGIGVALLALELGACSGRAGDPPTDADERRAAPWQAV